MSNLQNLYLALESPESCSYTQQEPGQAGGSGSLERLTISRESPSESVTLNQLNDCRTVEITYCGADSDAMLSTMDALQLPNSWPSNTGEKVFYLFKGQLKLKGGGPVRLTQESTAANIMGFKDLLQKIVERYES